MACDCKKDYDIKLVIHICRACDYYKTSQVTTSGGTIKFELCGATPGRGIESVAKDGGCPNCKWPKK